MVRVALRLGSRVRPAGTAGDELGDRSFDHAGVGSESPGGHEVVKDVFADDADEVDGGGFDDVRTPFYRSSATNHGTTRQNPHA